MSGEVVADTSPLIALARIGELDLLRRLYGRVALPPAVQAELAIGSDRPGARALEAALAAGWLSVQPVSDRAPGPDLSLLLGPGEAEAIVLAEERQARLLLIDDLRGRRIARRRGIPVAGVAGVLLAAKSRGEIAAVGPILRRLSKAGYRLAPRLVAEVVKAAGED